MLDINQKTSLLVPSQLPEFIRDNPEYENFVLFLQAYYEWMEQNGGVTYGSKNLLNYADIDKTTDQFINYFLNDFLPYFPKDSLVDKKLATKIAKQLYQTKGTPASYQFLFRTLYNSDFDLFYTKDSVLRASDGEWYIAKSLKIIYINSEKLGEADNDFLNIKNRKLFGETSKSIATVENSVVAGDKVEVFISNIERLFQSGEVVRLVDSNLQDVLDENGEPIRGKIVGQISQIKIDPNHRGTLYKINDPVIVYGGLSSNTGIGASAFVSSVTTGSIKRINTLTGGYGYSLSPNTQIQITYGGGATAIVGSVDPNPAKTANVSFIPSDTIALKRFVDIGNSNYHFSNIAVSNVNTTLANAFTFESFTTYPISSILVTNGGGGITTTPTVEAISTYTTDALEIPNLKSLGILAPIQITNGGNGYRVNDTIVFNGGSGHGAYANVTGVAANGAITTISYVSHNGNYPVGGEGYRADALPSVSVNSANVQASGASIYVPGILGDGATFAAVTDRVGSVSTISLTNYGEDYVSAPNVSLKVQDIVVTGVDVGNKPNQFDTIYQGTSIENATYIASYNSVNLLQPYSVPSQSVYNLRVYNYNTNIDPTQPLKIKGKNIQFIPANYAFDSSYNSSGVKTYGDGTAQAFATFLNGLTISGGQYLNNRGQPSGFDKLQSKIYNNYTYQITVEKEIAKYKDVLLSLLHPTGLQVLGRYASTSSVSFNYNTVESIG